MGKHIPPPPGPGRPKGSKNKLSGIAKENIASVFDGLGGVKGMTDWVKASPRNKETFYRDIYPKILALDVNHGGELSHVLTFMFGDNGNGEAHE
jgi:hypothetical protein